MKNKHHLQRLIGGLIALIGVGVGALGILFNNQSSTTFLIIGIVILALGGLWYGIATYNSRGVCDNCGEKMTGCQYQYQEVNREYTQQGNMQVKVEIIATCPYCGHQKRYRKTFYAKPGENIQYQVDNYCRGVFGH